jgi:hypothetical protein
MPLRAKAITGKKKLPCLLLPVAKTTNYLPDKN